MMVSAIVTLVAVLSATIADILPPLHGFRVVCYMVTEDNDNLKFNSSDAEPALHLCTHLIFPRAGIQDTSLDIKLYQDDGHYALDNIQNLVSMKMEKFPYLKILIGVGFIEGDNSPYPWMAKTPARRATFVQNILQFVMDHNLDGVDIGWTFAAYKPDFTNRNINQVLMLKQLRQEFDKHGLVVSVSIIWTAAGGELGVDIPGLAAQAHFINFGSHAHSGFHHDINRYSRHGVQLDKINMMVFSMGLVHKLKNPEKVKDKTELVNTVDPIGIMHYYRLCKYMEKEVWTEDFDINIGATYYTNEDLLVTIDNPVSTILKISFAMNATLGGIAFRALDSDDYKGECAESNGKYPMLREIDHRLVRFSSDAYVDIFEKLEQNDASYFWNGMGDKVIQK